VPDPKNNTPDWRDALRRELRGKARGIVGGVVLSAGIGLVLLTTGLGDGLVTKSYDLPFAFRPIIQPQGVVMVYLDDASHAHLNQKYLEPWNRAYYTRLLKRLTADHAAAVVFDVVFSDAMDPAVDQQFADAIQENGKVILAADWNIKEYGVAGQAVGKQLIMPYEKFNAVAADVGADTLFPDAGEYIRRYKPTIPNEKNPDEKIPSEAWVTAVLVNPSFNESNALSGTPSGSITTHRKHRCRRSVSTRRLRTTTPMFPRDTSATRLCLSAPRFKPSCRVNARTSIPPPFPTFRRTNGPPGSRFTPSLS